MVLGVHYDGPQNPNITNRISIAKGPRLWFCARKQRIGGDGYYRLGQEANYE
jgi:hypothetical protein